jgi:MoaA/NifB/PqqE/SkfB family radical SAM enzyme
MSAQTFQTVVDHMRRLSPLNFMILHHFGEPLLHPELPELIERASRAKLNPGFSTNGESLTEAGFRTLLRRGLRWLCITFHTPRGEAVFHELRGLAREHRLLYWGRKLVPTPVPNDGHAILDYGVEYQLQHSFAGAVAPERPQPPGWTPRCDYLRWNFVSVLHDGRVVPCGMDARGDHVLGDVGDLGSIKTGPSYELCRTCRGFRFLEVARSMMKRLRSTDPDRMDFSRWVETRDVRRHAEIKGEA